MKSRSFAVIGLGTFGSTVAKELAKYGNPVLGIDSNEQNVGRLADILTEAIIADGREEEALKEAGLSNYDVVVIAIGEDLEANILCTMNAKLLGVEIIWVKALNKTHHRILSRLGADRVIQPEQEVGQHIAQILHNPQVRDYVSLGNGFHVVDYKAPKLLEGASIKDPKWFEIGALSVLGFMRESDFYAGAADTPPLKEGDKLLLLGKREDLRQFGDTMRTRS